MQAEEEDLAVLISNMKTRRPKADPLKVARSVRRLRRRYGSFAKVAVKVDLDSHEMLREFDALLSLPAGVKDLYKKGILKSVVAGYWISRMNRSNEDKERLANAVVQYKLTAHDVRDAVAYAERKRNYSIPEVIGAITSSKKVERHYLAVVSLNNVTIRILQKVAKEKEIEPELLLRKTIGTIVKAKNILSIALKGSIVTMRLDERGFNAVQLRAKAKNMELEDLINDVTGTWLRSSLR